ncbi:LysR substrate-binding domain-containing protein [Luteimonas sp. RD2P54]|uniref:LysR substrate-binding domain-containing protein n=1 Tax=Luteimonas endophytica TaxID=3042023 RepID=A0ABT6JFN0_9GAMM|nr:LysR substrate-binding domain-containing protein [Luteimonas endophytica]MDH5824993.1 LysR substrate-binding domain-containing protein [Luteimonas endophytica]
MDLDPTLLRTFVAVADTGSFTRAAQRQHLTQSAVSHQIRRLEEQVGRRLLRRTTRSLAMTEDGEELLRHAQRILHSFDALARRFRPSPLSGTVRFGAPENFMGERLPRLLCRFARDFPAVRLDASISANLDLPALIRTGELDLAVVISLPGPGAAPGRPLRRTRLVWVAAATFEPPPGAPLPFAFYPPPCVHRQVGVRALEEAGIERHIVFTSHSQEGIHAAVLAGLAITAIAHDDLEAGMRIIDGRYGLPPLPEIDFSLVWSSGGKTPASTAFGELICEMA